MEKEPLLDINNPEQIILWNTACEVEYLNIISLETNLSIARKKMEVQKLNRKRIQDLVQIETQILDNDEICKNMESLGNKSKKKTLSIDNPQQFLKNELQQKISQFQKRILLAKSEIDKSQNIIETQIPYFNQNLLKNRPKLSNELKKATTELSLLKKQLGDVKTKKATKQLKVLLRKPPFPPLLV